MYSFLFRTLSSARSRTIGILLAFFLSASILFLLIFVFQNIREGVTYYTLQGIQENRITITHSSNILQLLDRDIGGIPEKTIEKIQQDPNIASYKIFRFVDIPVLGTFHLFQFALTIDVPVFSLEDSDMSLQGVGISQGMLTYYNMQFAGTHPIFPLFSEKDLLGKGVTLQFGASKLFSLSGSVSTPLSMKIDQINPDFPGFGVVIPYLIARDQMQTLGYRINQPYRIVIILKHLTDRSALEDRYPGLTLQYDRDTIQEKEKIFQNIAEILTFCGIILFGIISSFLFLLFLGYFREKQYVFDLIRIYRIGGYGYFLIILGEPILLLTFAALLSTLLIWFIQRMTIIGLQDFLTHHGILFGLIPLSLHGILIIILGDLALLIILLFLIFFRRKIYH